MAAPASFIPEAPDSFIPEEEEESPTGRIEVPREFASEFQEDPRRIALQRAMEQERMTPRMTTGGGFREELEQNIGDIGRAALGFIPQALRTIGVIETRGAGQRATKYPELYPPPQTFTPESHPAYKAGEQVEQTIGEIFPRREDAGLDTSVREGFGQMASMVGAGGLARAAGAGAAGVVGAATTLGGVMEFDDAFQRARQRKDDPDTAFAKALGYAGVASLIENRLGAGRILRQMFPSASEAARKITALGVSKKILGNFIAGGAEEAGQRAAQNWIVEGKPSMEGVMEEALPGAIVQGVVGLPGAATQQIERTPDAVQPETEAPVPGVSQPEVPQQVAGEVPVTPSSPQAAEARVETPTPPGPGIVAVEWPEKDFKRYSELRQQQNQLQRENKILNPNTGELTPEWMENMREFEALRNKHNGMPPIQVSISDQMGLEYRGTISSPSGKRVWSFHDPQTGSNVAIPQGSTFEEAKQKIEASRAEFAEGGETVEKEKVQEEALTEAAGTTPAAFFPRQSESLGLGEPAVPPTVETVRQQRAQEARTAVPPAPGEKTTPSRGTYFAGLNPRETAAMMQERATAFQAGKTEEQAIVDLARAAAGDPSVQLDDQAANFVIKDLLVRLNARIRSTKNPVDQQQSWAQIDRLAELSRRLGAEPARSLGSRHLAYKQIDWLMPVMAWRGIVQAKWRKLLNIAPDKPVTEALKEVAPTPAQTAETTEDEVEQNSAESAAQSIIDKLATSQSDTPKWSKETLDGVRETVKWYILGDITDAEFQATMGTLKVNPNTTRVLLGVANREWAIREGYRQRQTVEQKARRQNQAEMRKLRAQAYIAFKTTGQAGSTADAIITRYAKEQSDTQAWSSKVYNTVKEVFKLYLDGDATVDEFKASMQSAGVTNTQIQSLLGVANRELQTREFYRRAKEQENLKKLIRDPGKINAILRKLGAEGQVNWSNLFLDDPRATQDEWRKYLSDAINRDPRFAALSTEDRTALASSLESAWQTQRMNIFRQQFRKLIRLPEVKVAKIERELIPELIRQANLGTLDDQAFLDAFAKKLRLPEISGSKSKKLTDLSQKAQSEPQGVKRNKTLDEMVKILQTQSPISKMDLLRDVWYGSVLARVGTMLNVLAGSYATGASFAGLSALDRLARLHPIQAAKIISQFIGGSIEGTIIADQIARKGAYHLLPDAEQRMVNLLSGKAGSRFDNLESLLKRKNPIGVLAYTRRFMAALDYIGALGTRDAMVLYGALSRGDQESLDAMDKKFDRAENRRAAEQAKAEMGPKSSMAERLVRKREILEEGVSDEIQEAAVNVSRRAAQNSDPRGIPGMVYKATSKLPFFARAPLGLAFMRSAMNMVQNAMDYTPGIGLSTAIRGKLNELPESHPLHRFGLDVPIEERRMMVAAQGASLGVAAIAAALFLGDDDEDDDMEISGSWLGLTPERRRQLMDAGERPNSIRFKKGGNWINFKQMPFAPPLAMVGTMRDQQRFHGKDWNGESSMSKLAAAYFGGLLYIRDISSLSGVAGIFDKNSWSAQDPTKIDQTANRFAANSVGRFAGGYIPSVLKEIDEFGDPTLYRPSKEELAGWWIRNIPYARRTVGPGPALNNFGEPVQLTPPPIKAWVGLGKDNDLYNTLGQLASRGIFLPEPGQTAKIVDGSGTYRTMTEDEWYRFIKIRGPIFKARLTPDRLKVLATAKDEDAIKWLKATSEESSESARNKMFPLSRYQFMKRTQPQ